MKYEQGKGKNRTNPKRELSNCAHKYAIIIWTRECGCAYACHLCPARIHTHTHTGTSTHCIIYAKLLHLLAASHSYRYAIIVDYAKCVCACPSARAHKSMQQHFHAVCMRNESFIPNKLPPNEQRKQKTKIKINLKKKQATLKCKCIPPKLVKKPYIFTSLRNLVYLCRINCQHKFT